MPKSNPQVAGQLQHGQVKLNFCFFDASDYYPSDLFKMSNNKSKRSSSLFKRNSLRIFSGVFGDNGSSSNLSPTPESKSKLSRRSSVSSKLSAKSKSNHSDNISGHSDFKHSLTVSNSDLPRHNSTISMSVPDVPEHLMEQRKILEEEEEPEVKKIELSPNFSDIAHNHETHDEKRSLGIPSQVTASSSSQISFGSTVPSNYSRAATSGILSSISTKKLMRRKPPPDTDDLEKINQFYHSSYNSTQVDTQPTNGHASGPSEIDELGDQLNELNINHNKATIESIDTDLSRQSSQYPATQPSSSVYASSEGKPMLPVDFEAISILESTKDLINQPLQVPYSSLPLRLSNEDLNTMISDSRDLLVKQHEEMDKQQLLLSPENRDNLEHQNLKRRSLIFSGEDNNLIEIDAPLIKIPTESTQFADAQSNFSNTQPQYPVSQHLPPMFNQDDDDNSEDSFNFSQEPLHLPPPTSFVNRSRGSSFGQVSNADTFKAVGQDHSDVETQRNGEDTSHLYSAGLSDRFSQDYARYDDDESDDGYLHNYGLNLSPQKQLVVRNNSSSLSSISKPTPDETDDLSFNTRDSEMYSYANETPQEQRKLKLVGDQAHPYASERNNTSNSQEYFFAPESNSIGDSQVYSFNPDKDSIAEPVPETKNWNETTVQEKNYFKPASASISDSAQSINQNQSLFDYDKRENVIPREVRGGNAGSEGPKQRRSNPHLPNSIYDPAEKVTKNIDENNQAEVRNIPIKQKIPGFGQKCVYVEVIRERTSCANSNNSKNKWTLPIGIRPLDKKLIRRSTDMSPAEKRMGFGKYRKDIKHLSLQPRLLATGDDLVDDGDLGDGVILNNRRGSVDGFKGAQDYEKKRQNSRTDSFGSDGENIFAEFVNDKYYPKDISSNSSLPPDDNTASLGRMSSILSNNSDEFENNPIGGGLHLYVANPDND